MISVSVGVRDLVVMVKGAANLTIKSKYQKHMYQYMFFLLPVGQFIHLDYLV